MPSSGLPGHCMMWVHLYTCRWNTHQTYKIKNQNSKNKAIKERHSKSASGLCTHAQAYLHTNTKVHPTHTHALSHEKTIIWNSLQRMLIRVWKFSNMNSEAALNEDANPTRLDVWTVPVMNGSQRILAVFWNSILTVPSSHYRGELSFPFHKISLRSICRKKIHYRTRSCMTSQFSTAVTK